MKESRILMYDSANKGTPEQCFYFRIKYCNLMLSNTCKMRHILKFSITLQYIKLSKSTIECW